MTPRTRVVRRVCGVAVAAWTTATTLGATLGAHPVSTTTVSVVIEGDGRYVATITAEADPLIAKLEALSDKSWPMTDAPTARGRAHRANRLDALRDTMLAHIRIAFDGVAASPSPEPAVVSDAGQVTIRLTGVPPAGARSVSWSSSMMYGSYPLAVRTSDGREVVRWLQGPESSDAIALTGASRVSAIWRGLRLGFTHILPNGIDHILFVVGLFLLSTRPGQLLAQVSAFTLAHSITLGLSLYGVLSLQPRIVEPLIALSVAYVGIENLMTSRLHPWRVAIVFGFGLLHGLGFAEALASLRLSRPDLLSMLISFNLGVEGGQLAVIAIAALAVGIATKARATWRRPIATLASGAIGLTGLFWTIQRLW